MNLFQHKATLCVGIKLATNKATEVRVGPLVPEEPLKTQKNVIMSRGYQAELIDNCINWRWHRRYV